jgi:ribosome-associated protein
MTTRPRTSSPSTSRANPREKLTKSGVKKVSIEGLTQGEWVLLDGGDVIVHLFKPEVRSFYNLEKMWGAELPEAERITAVG